MRGPSGLRPGLALAAGGAGCWVLGRWRRGAARHSLYFVPLQYWGLAYVALGVLAAIAGAAALVRPGV